MDGMKFKKGFSSLEDLNDKATLWLNNVANNRIHGTTGEKPSERWLKEKPNLHFPGNLPSYPVAALVVRMSTKDGLIQYKYNFYSVPIEFARRKLLVEETSESGVGKLKIYQDNALITTHFMSRERGKWIAKDEHLIKKINSTQTKKQKLKKENKITKEIRIYTRPLSYYDQIIFRRKINE